MRRGMPASIVARIHAPFFFAEVEFPKIFRVSALTISRQIPCFSPITLIHLISQIGFHYSD